MTNLATLLQKGMNNADTSEVVDTILDVLQAASVIEEQLQDGYQLSDFWAAFELNPIGKEISQDFGEFTRQLKLLPTQNTALIAQAIGQGITQRKIELYKYTGIAANFIYWVGLAYSEALEIINRLTESKNQLFKVLEGGSIIAE